MLPHIWETIICPTVLSIIKQLDRLSSDTKSASDSYIEVFVEFVQELVEKVPDSVSCKVQLLKKFYLVVANTCLRMQDFENAGTYIQKSCAFIQTSDRDQLKVYFLAFKMQCQLKDQDEAMTVFQQLLASQHITAEPIIECFDILIQNKLYDLALGLGSHYLKTCD